MWEALQGTANILFSHFKMVAKHFYLLGEAITSARPIDVETTVDYKGLQLLIAGQFAIVDPNGKALSHCLLNSS
jgi:hypothetical protein